MDLNLIQCKTAIKLEPMAGLNASYHLFNKAQKAAISAAYYAQRPLLVRGEPGLGKSQLAHAIAQCQKWDLIKHVINSRTEIDDLFYRVDHVARLAKAQLLQHQQDDITELDDKNFVVPGPLWWAYAPESAAAFYKDGKSHYQTQFKVDSAKPTVLLIDEIDKADSDLPNALLEILNNHSFHAYGHDKVISCEPDKRPFVVITSNDERQLPGAFLRRCVCLPLTMSSGDKGVAELVAIARAHQMDKGNMGSEIIEQVAQMVIDKRQNTHHSDNSYAASTYIPGTSEFLDLLRVLNGDLYKDDDQRRQALAEISQYILNK